MVDINNKIKENVLSIFKDKDFLDYLKNKIKEDPIIVKKRLLFNFLYENNNFIFIDRADIRQLSDTIYFIFINEVKQLLHLKNTNNA